MASPRRTIQSIPMERNGEILGDRISYGGEFIEEDYRGFARRRDNDMHLDSRKKDYYDTKKWGTLFQFDVGFSRENLLTSSKFQWKNLLSKSKLGTANTEMNPSALMNHSTASLYHGNTTSATTVMTERDCHLCNTFLSYGQSGGVLLQKPVSVDYIDRGRSYSPYHLHGGRALLSRDLHGSNQGEGSHLDNQLGREIYEKDDDFIVASNYGILCSQSKNYGTDCFIGSYMESVHVPLYDSRLSSEIINMPLGHDCFSKQLSPPLHEDPREPGKGDLHVYVGPDERRYRNYNYQEQLRVEMHETGFMSDELYGKVVASREGYDPRHFLRSDIIDPIVNGTDGCSPREQMRNHMLADRISAQVQLNAYHFHGSGLAKEQGREAVGYRSTHPEYEEAFEDHESVLSREDDGYERTGGSWTCAERSEMLPVASYDLPCSNAIDGSLHQRLMVEESSRTRKRKSPVDNDLSKLNFRSSVSGKGNNSCNNTQKESKDGEWTGEDGYPSKRSRFSNLNQRDSGMASHETVSHVAYNYVPANMLNNISRPDESATKKLRDIKQRLGPRPKSVNASLSFDYKQKLPVNSRLGPGPKSKHASHYSESEQKRPMNQQLGTSVHSLRASHSSVDNHRTPMKKRLGPCPRKIQVAPPWLEETKVRKLASETHEGIDACNQEGESSKGDSPAAKASKMAIKTLQITDGAHEQERKSSNGDNSPANLAPADVDPAENSVEFKKMVDKAFLKYVKQVNENVTYRRRLLGPVKADSLKCDICGSKSEFEDTESLVAHAYTSSKVEYRTLHLGFHKALCLLMGWNCAMEFNSPWVRESLPEAEYLNVKEDLIIWPPVIIIHNGSIRNNDPDRRVIVSTEMLEARLKGMGFAERTKIGHGRPANQSVIVVKFESTLTGLQEAERLHKFYADKKHGRSEFHLQHADYINNNSNSEQADKVEDVLYGYLGIAEDLDKLAFEAKKRCQVRSKKEILGVADQVI